MPGKNTAPASEPLFETTVVQEFYKRVNDRLPDTNQLPYEPYDEDEVIGLVTLYALMDGSRKERIAKADPLVSLLQGKSAQQAMTEAANNKHPIGYMAVQELLTTGARGVAKCLAKNSFVYASKSKIRKV